MEIDMSKLIYSRNGSETTESITNAQPQIQAIWNQAHRFGANIVRVRAEKLRYGNSTGKTFNSFHEGYVSVYKQKDKIHESDALYFARKIPLTKVNKGMQILEIASNVDVQDTLDTIDTIQYYSETSLFGRLWNRIRYGTPMSINS
jgi:tetrahydromethanopterin S-methyltransferase subunit A